MYRSTGRFKKPHRTKHYNTWENGLKHNTPMTGLKLVIVLRFPYVSPSKTRDPGAGPNLTPGL